MTTLYAHAVAGLGLARWCAGRPMPWSYWTLAAILPLLPDLDVFSMLLDALTRGGEGIPLFWPLGGRYGNWGPIPVSDIAFDWPDPRTSRAIRGELLWVWLPTMLLIVVTAAYRLVRRGRVVKAPQRK